MLKTKKEVEEGKSERLVLGPVTVVASDSKAAAIVAVMDKADGRLMTVDHARMEVLVRPFV